MGYIPGYVTDETGTLVDVASAECKALNEAQQAMVDPLHSGFLWYTPPMHATKSGATTTAGIAAGGGGGVTSSTALEWVISGHDMQVLTMSMPPGQEIFTEVGSFMYGSGDIKTSVELTLCSRKGCGEGIQRVFGGESCVKVILTNADEVNTGVIGLTPNFPAKVIPIQFGNHIHEDHALIAKGGAYMAQVGDVRTTCDLDCSILRCCCAGLGTCRQKMVGPKDSVAFLAAGGTLVYRELKANETIVVDSFSVVALEESVTMGLKSNGRICMCCLGGEGCCSTTFTGPGKIFMQSMSFQKFQAAVQQTVIDDRGSSTNNSPSGGGDGGF